MQIHLLPAVNRQPRFTAGGTYRAGEEALAYMIRSIYEVSFFYYKFINLSQVLKMIKFMN